MPLKVHYCGTKPYISDINIEVQLIALVVLLVCQWLSISMLFLSIQVYNDEPSLCGCQQFHIHSSNSHIIMLGCTMTNLCPQPFHIEISTFKPYLKEGYNYFPTTDISNQQVFSFEILDLVSFEALNLAFNVINLFKISLVFITAL